MDRFPPHRSVGNLLWVGGTFEVDKRHHLSISNIYNWLEPFLKRRSHSSLPWFLTLDSVLGPLQVKMELNGHSHPTWMYIGLLLVLGCELISGFSFSSKYKSNFVSSLHVVVTHMWWIAAFCQAYMPLMWETYVYEVVSPHPLETSTCWHSGTAFCLSCSLVHSFIHSCPALTTLQWNFAATKTRSRAHW